jgi:hypothetical protein
VDAKHRKGFAKFTSRPRSERTLPCGVPTRSTASRPTS